MASTGSASLSRPCRRRVMLTSRLSESDARIACMSPKLAPQRLCAADSSRMGQSRTQCTPVRPSGIDCKLCDVSAQQRMHGASA
ncbi:hypothetical protein U91I_02580 [alpha proteobacterium U9-1i]|nr:hypothetical protein U91I_02580 [alpha proteobacterium U9-1i]